MIVKYGPGFGVKTQATQRKKAERLERAMLALPQADCPVRHYFAPGMYAREMTIPKGVTATGAVHKTEHLIVVSMGLLRVSTEGGWRDVAAGETIVCKPGMKNAVHALEASRWTNFLPNPDNCTATDQLTELFTESKASELLGGTDNMQLLAQAAAERIEA
jgi:hypothetical protein